MAGGLPALDAVHSFQLRAGPYQAHTVGAGLVPARGRPQGPPLLPGFRSRRAILRRLDVGAGAHTRPELAGGPEVRADVGIGPYRGLLRQAPPGQNAP